MKIINIETKKLIEDLGGPDGVYWTTPESWISYKRDIQKFIDNSKLKNYIL